MKYDYEYSSFGTVEADTPEAAQVQVCQLIRDNTEPSQIDVCECEDEDGGTP